MTHERCLDCWICGFVIGPDDADVTLGQDGAGELVIVHFRCWLRATSPVGRALLLADADQAPAPHTSGGHDETVS